MENWEYFALFLVMKTFTLVSPFNIINVMVLWSNVGNVFCFSYKNNSHMLNGVVFCPSQNVDILKDPETVKQLGSILKTNVRACKAVGHPFVIQLGRIYLDMLNVYKCLSENISAAIQANGKRF